MGERGLLIKMREINQERYNKESIRCEVMVEDFAQLPRAGSPLADSDVCGAIVRDTNTGQHRKRGRGLQ
jgi:hypothetical protein